MAVVSECYSIAQDITAWERDRLQLFIKMSCWMAHTPSPGYVTAA